MKWHSEFSRRSAPPQQQFTFSPPPTGLHICDSLARRMCCRLMVGLCRRSSNSSPSFTTPPYYVFAPSLLSSLDSHHHPAVVPQPPIVTVVHWHTFIALRCLSSAAVVLCRILPYSLVCRHGFGICWSSVATSNNAFPLPHSRCSSIAVLFWQPPSSSAALLCRSCSSSIAW